MRTTAIRPRGLLIFDLDGTLFRTETVTVPAVQRVFRDRGLQAPAGHDIRQRIGCPADEFHAWLRSHCPGDLAAAVLPEVDSLESELIEHSGELFPGIREVLMRLNRLAAEMVVCSSGPPDYVGQVLRAHRIDRFFVDVRSRRTRDDTKLRMIRELMQRWRSRPAIAIGDRRDDIVAARQNGARAVAVTYGYGRPAELTAADRTANVPADLPGIVEALLRSTAAATLQSSPARLHRTVSGQDSRRAGRWLE